jgi:hypothetical protein
MWLVELREKHKRVEAGDFKFEIPDLKGFVGIVRI